ncbi:hypothetical protein IFR05_001928 [Cadophora sp. M221]|nr:hypothetical protein IFR05_001928 [Cadophora sp. M221]
MASAGRPGDAVFQAGRTTTTDTPASSTPTAAWDDPAKSPSAGDAQPPAYDNFVTPAISMPKGGGAIRSIGERFQANALTGTATINIPIATTPGRGGFGPSLELTYDSGNGNGPFGFGWSSPVAAVTRKTSTGIPRYLDHRESDVFLLSGSEELVPVLGADGSRYERPETALGFRVNRYRPRVESAFSMIERWTSLSDVTDVYWRQISSENILTVYGKDGNSRISNPEAPGEIYSWLVCEIRDVSGNASLFTYKAENGDGIDLGLSHQLSRGAANDSGRTANRYLKSIKYGNRRSLLDVSGSRPFSIDPKVDPQWLFELVLDYGEHDINIPTPSEIRPWNYRDDSFSTCKAGFEIRTCRLCIRALMFHHFPDERDVGDNCLVSSTDLIFNFDSTPQEFAPYRFLKSVQQHGYFGTASTGYIKRPRPSVDFDYSSPTVTDVLQEVTSQSLVNMPSGLATPGTTALDLFGEGIPGFLSQADGVWYYKRNITPIAPDPPAQPTFSEAEQLDLKPNVPLSPRPMLTDLTGDGSLAIVDTQHGVGGFYLSDTHDGWLPFTHFPEIANVALDNPAVKMVDLSGDGSADMLVVDENVWYRSRWQRGFAKPEVPPIIPGLGETANGVLRNDVGYITFADMSGDGLADLVDVRHSSISYLPNLGYGRFGRRIYMDNAPVFDNYESFDPKNLIFVDVDGSGTTDIIHLGASGVKLYFNESGNAWSAAQPITSAPQPSHGISVTALDLLGTGTSCLVFSNPNLPPGHGSMQYIDLIGSQKPHLLTKMNNNFGLITTISYSTSTKFYLQDRRDGTPWITRLANLVHVVETVMKDDDVSKSTFSTRYRYRHGFFDAKDREFRGFGMVDQWDTSAYGAMDRLHDSPDHSSIAPLPLPPSRTRTWFHLGITNEAGKVSQQYESEYFHDPSFNDGAALLLPDTVLPDGIEDSEVHDACRALKGRTLRVELYADDSTPSSSTQAQARSKLPFRIVESNYTIKKIQSKLDVAWRSGVFSLVDREGMEVQLERSTIEPLIRHSFTLETNEFDQALKQMVIAYGRTSPDTALPLPQDVTKQSQSWISFKTYLYTNPVDDPVKTPGHHLIPRKCETKSYQVTGLDLTSRSSLFTYLSANGVSILTGAKDIRYEDAPDLSAVQKRLLKWSRILLRKNDLTGLLPLGQVESRVVPGQGFDLAFTDSLLDSSFKQSSNPLLLDKSILTSQAGDGGGYIASSNLIFRSLFPNDQLDGYWIPTPQLYFSQSQSPGAELQQAIENFFFPVKYVYPMSSATQVQYDKYNLSILDSTDALGNRISVGDRLANGTINPGGFDYRVLQPRVVSDVNRNRTKFAFDALGVLVGQAVQGKPEESLGDILDDFEANLDESVILQFLQNPSAGGIALLSTATTRTVYDLFAYSRSTSQPSVSCTISRFTHATTTSEVGAALEYFDGFGRPIQNKTQVNPGPIASRDSQSRIILDSDNRPVLTTLSSDPRWLTSGWVINDNKGNAVYKYEPYFTDKTEFEFDVRIGATSIQFYDALSRQFASFLPNNSYSKILWTPWTLTSYDTNDTVMSDPRTDPDLQGYVDHYFSGASNFATWYESRAAGQMGNLEKQGALKAASLADAPTIQYFDALGRGFLNSTQVKTVLDGHDLNNTTQPSYTRFDLDIDGNKLAVRDAVDRTIETFSYDMMGRAFRMSSVDGGTRVTLLNVMKRPVRQWDPLGRQFRFDYDITFRPLHTFVRGDTATTTSAGAETLVQLQIYGDVHPEAEQRNMKGKLFMTLEQSGCSSTERFDFKGNPSQFTQRISKAYSQTNDWGGVDAVVPSDYSHPVDLTALGYGIDSLTKNEAFLSDKTYDAQNRVIAYTSPSSNAATQSPFRLTYEVGILTSIACNVRRATVDGSSDLAWKSYASELDYDARGMRTSVVYDNGSRTTYVYDVSKQLTRQRTTRDFAATSDVLQDLHFTYDPNFNVMSIEDLAQQTLFFRNQIIQPIKLFTYDSIGRLIGANGREHIGQQSGAPAPYSAKDSSSFGPQPGDANAFTQYQEMYVYDMAGNMMKMKHDSSNAVQTTQSSSWTRAFVYREPSPFEPGKFGNRLTSSSVGNATAKYSYDGAGCCTYMPHLTGGTSMADNMHWDMFGQFRQADLGGGGTAYFCYNETGRRVRKVVEKDVNLMEERIYLDGLEIFRRHRSGQVVLERETLHLMDDISRVALVETRTIDTSSSDPGPGQIFRYQLSDFLGSATIELDANGKILTYEEYSPYGSTTYQAADPGLELPKRYRFSGKERDEETGLAYFGARYYAPWLARWASTDPKGTAGGLNTYEYASSNPVKFVDPDGKEPKWMQGVRNVANGLAEKAGMPIKVIENIAKGIDAQHLYGQALEHAGPVIKQVKLANDAVSDFITKGWQHEHKFIDIEKYIKNGELLKDEKLAERIRAGLRHGLRELEGLEGATGEKLVKFMEETGQAVGELGQKVVYSIEADEKVAEQFLKYAGEVAGEMGGDATKLSLEVLRYAPSAELKALLEGLGHGAVGIIVLYDGYKVWTSDDMTEKIIAGVDAAGNIMLFIPIPAVQVAGGVLVAGGMVAGYVHDKNKEKQQTPTPEVKKKPASKPEPKAGPDLAKTRDNSPETAPTTAPVANPSMQPNS